MECISLIGCCDDAPPDFEGFLSVSAYDGYAGHQPFGKLTQFPTTLYLTLNRVITEVPTGKIWIERITYSACYGDLGRPSIASTESSGPADGSHYSLAAPVVTVKESTATHQLVHYSDQFGSLLMTLSQDLSGPITLAQKISSLRSIIAARSGPGGPISGESEAWNLNEGTCQPQRASAGVGKDYMWYSSGYYFEQEALEVGGNFAAMEIGLRRKWYYTRRDACSQQWRYSGDSLERISCRANWATKDNDQRIFIVDPDETRINTAIDERTQFGNEPPLDECCGIKPVLQ